jgi:hypothetical protein
MVQVTMIMHCKVPAARNAHLDAVIPDALREPADAAVLLGCVRQGGASIRQRVQRTLAAHGLQEHPCREWSAVGPCTTAVALLKASHGGTQFQLQMPCCQSHVPAHVATTAPCPGC